MGKKIIIFTLSLLLSFSFLCFSNKDIKAEETAVAGTKNNPYKIKYDEYVVFEIQASELVGIYKTSDAANSIDGNSGVSTSTDEENTYYSMLIYADEGYSGSYYVSIKDNQNNVTNYYFDVVSDDLGSINNPYQINSSDNLGVVLPFAINKSSGDVRIGIYKSGSEDNKDYLIDHAKEDNGEYFDMDVWEGELEGELGGANIHARHDCSGLYYARIKNPSDNSNYDIYFNVNKQNGGGQGGDQHGPTDRFTYNGENYQFGFANGSSDGKTLHIDGGGGHQSSGIKIGETRGGSFFGVGLLNDQDQILHSASQELINEILKTLSITSEKEGISFNYSKDYHFDDKAVEGGINTKEIETTFNTKEPGEYPVKIEFDLDADKDGTAEHYQTTYHLTISSKVDLYVDAESELTGVTGNTVIEKLNNLFSSTEKFVDFVKTINNGNEPDGNTEITFGLKSGEEYTGQIEINCTGDYKIAFRTNGEGKATIKGGIINHGSLRRVSNINFVADQSSKFNYGGNDITVGIVAYNTDEQWKPEENKTADIYNVHDCTFNGYDCAVLSYENSLVSGIQRCTFKDNKTAICIDTKNNMSYSDTLENTFVDNNVAVHLVRRPKQASALQFVYSRNNFYGEGIDYKVGSSEMNSGVHFFIDSYYGTSYAAGLTNNNFRGSRVEYEKGSPAVIVTGPCIRFPEDDNKTGFDTGNGATNKLHNGADINIRVDDLLNNSKVKVDVYDDGSGTDLGSLSFGGAQ